MRSAAKTFGPVVLTLLLLLPRSAPAVPPPPSPAQLARVKECEAYRAFHAAPVALKVSALPSPSAPALLNYQWGVRLQAPGRAIGKVIGIGFLPVAGEPTVMAVTDGGYWIVFHIRAGQLVGQPEAFAIRDLPGMPAHAAALGGQMLLDIPAISRLVSFDVSSCGVAARPLADTGYGPGRKVTRLDAHSLGLEIEFSDTKGRQVLAYPGDHPVFLAGHDELQPLSWQTAKAFSEAVTVHSDFPLGQGCDRLSLAALPGGRVRMTTSCSSDFAATEAAMETSTRKGHRVPAAVTTPSVVGVIDAPIFAMAAGQAEIPRNMLRQDVPFDDHSNPGMPAMLYMAARPAGDVILDLFAYRPYRAYFPKAPGGVDPPPPPP